MLQRVITCVAVAVEVLRIGWIGYKGVRTEPAANRRVIPPRTHLDQLNVTVLALAGVANIGGQGTSLADVAPGIYPAPLRFGGAARQLAGDDGATRVGGEAGAGC